MESDWLAWFVALLPGAATLMVALYSFDAGPALVTGAKRSWSDIPTVEALQDLLLHSVFYAPLWVFILIEFIINPAKVEGEARYVVVLASAAAVGTLFALGRGCIAKVRQLEYLEELAVRRREEDRLSAAASRP